MRAFHLHPLMANPPGMAPMPPGTIDDAYVDALGREERWIHVVTDSDEACQVEMSSVRDTPNLDLPGPATPAGVARFALREASPLHRRFVRIPLRLHGSQPVDWRPAEAQAEQVLAAVWPQLRLIEACHRLLWPARFARRAAGAVRRRIVNCVTR